MSTLATIFGLFGLTLGLVGLISPATLVRFSRPWLSQRGPVFVRVWACAALLIDSVVVCSMVS